MGWDRGAWERRTSETSFAGKRSTLKSSSSSDTNKKCLICGNCIEYDVNKPFCPYCGHYYYFNFIQKRSLLKKFKNMGWHSSQEKDSQFISSKFYIPIILENENEIIEYCGNLLITNYHYSPVLYVSNSNERITAMNKFFINLGMEECIYNINEDSDNYLKKLVVKKESKDVKENFNTINSYLNKNFSLKEFNNFSDMRYIPYLNVLEYNCQYIDSEDAEELNTFLKVYWEYLNFLDDFFLDFDKRKNLTIEYVEVYSKELFNLKEKIFWMNESIIRVNSYFKLLDISCSNLSEKIEIIDDLLLLKDNPQLINLNLSTENFINLLKKYQANNDSKIPVIEKVKNLKEKCFYFAENFQVYYNYISYEHLFNEFDSEENIFNQDFLLFNDFRGSNNLFSNSYIIKLNKFNNGLEKIKELLKINDDDVYKSIKMLNEIVDDLFNLIKNQFNVLNNISNDFNESSIEYYYDYFKNELSDYSKLYDIESEFDVFDEIIENNLSDIWTGFFSDVNEIEYKLKIDQEFTKSFNVNLFTNNVIEKFQMLSSNDIEFLTSFKSKINKNKKDYICLYENRIKLLNKINKLSNLDKNNFKECYTILNEINSVLNMSKLNRIIKCLEEIMNQEDYMNVNSEYLEKLNQYNDVYQKYFNTNEFNITFEDLTDKLNRHIIFTELINNNIVTLDSLPKIYDHIDDFLDNVNKFEELSKIMQDGDLTSDKNDLESTQNIIYISHVDDAMRLLDKKFINYFNCVILDDDDFILHENRLQSFLISKNNLYRVWNNRG